MIDQMWSITWLILGTRQFVIKREERERYARVITKKPSFIFEEQAKFEFLV